MALGELGQGALHRAGRLLGQLAQGHERERLGAQEQQRLEPAGELGHRRRPTIAMSPKGSAWDSVTSPRRASSSVAMSVTASSSGPRRP